MTPLFNLAHVRIRPAALRIRLLRQNPVGCSAKRGSLLATH
jgi:hypothetical protein